MVTNYLDQVLVEGIKSHLNIGQLRNRQLLYPISDFLNFLLS